MGNRDMKIVHSLSVKEKGEMHILIVCLVFQLVGVIQFEGRAKRAET